MRQCDVIARCGCRRKAGGSINHDPATLSLPKRGCRPLYVPLQRVNAGHTLYVTNLSYEMGQSALQHLIESKTDVAVVGRLSFTALAASVRQHSGNASAASLLGLRPLS